MRVLRQNLLAQFSATFVTMAALALLLAFVLASRIRADAINDLVLEAVGASTGRLLGALTPADLLEPMTGDRYDAFDSFVRQSIVSQRTARVKVWAKDGTVIYSNDPAGVGAKHPTNDLLQTALRGDNAYEIKLPLDAENDRERMLGSLIEVYTPIIFPGVAEPQGVFELYQYYEPTAQRITTLLRWLFGSLAVGFLVLYSALVSIVWRGWRTIERQRQALEHLAYHDPLTGAGNRRLLRARMDEETGSGLAYTLALVDVDGLRAINNRHGHGLGDEALVRVAARLQAAAGHGDLVARLGGDEFVFFSTRGKPELSRVFDTLRDPMVLRHEDVSVPVSFCYGIAAYPDDGDTPEVLFALADFRMYEQKTSQGGREHGVAERDPQTGSG